MTLKDRIEDYKSQTDYKLLNKVPLVIVLNGRGFSKFTSLLDKPYDLAFANAMEETLYYLCSNIEGVLFGYQYHDQIVLILRNDKSLDTNAWYDNKIQKICSITASMASVFLNNKTIDQNTIGTGLFLSQVFMLPNINEAINTIIYKQQHNFYVSLQIALFYELLKKHDENSIKRMMNGLNHDEKIDLLQQECNIDFEDYSLEFRRGIACYRVPKIVNQTIKNKWFINKELVVFSKDKDFLYNIFEMFIEK